MISIATRILRFSKHGKTFPAHWSTMFRIGQTEILQFVSENSQEKGSFNIMRSLAAMSLATASFYSVSYADDSQQNSALVNSSTVIRKQSISPEDSKYLKMANDKRLIMDAPSQSYFRVVCVITFEYKDGAEGYVVGGNSESSFIGGAICAERAAICQLQLIKKNIRRIKGVYLVTDSEKEVVPPGVLCREFLLSHADTGTQVFMGTPIDAIHGFQEAMTSTLGELYPYASAYARVERKDILKFAKKISSKVEERKKNQNLFESETENILYQKVLTATKYDKRDDLHPIRYAAGVLYNNGHIDLAWESKALEYGNSIDPVSKLIAQMEAKNIPNKKNQNENVIPVVIMQMDQFGILHAPFAPARSYLSEYDLESVLIYAHKESGELIKCLSGDLVPSHLESLAEAIQSHS